MWRWRWRHWRVVQLTSCVRIRIHLPKQEAVFWKGPCFLVQHGAQMVHLVTHPTYLACQAAQILLRHTAGLHAALAPSPSFRPPRLHTAPQLPRFSGCMLPLPYLPLPARVTPPRSFTLTLLCPPACMQVGKVGITLCLGRARADSGRSASLGIPMSCDYGWLSSIYGYNSYNYYNRPFNLILTDLELIWMIH